MVFHENEWWFCVKDVLEALTDTTDGNRYSRDLRSSDQGLADSWNELTQTLKHESGAGLRETQFTNLEGIFRLMQSVPSGKAEAFKKWIAKVAFERVQEIANPELAIKRAMAIYHAKGYPDEWVEARIQNKVSREKLETQWSQRGVKGQEYALLTDAISLKTFGIKTSRHKEIKKLKGQPLRDNMTPIELTLTTLGEQTTNEIVKAKNARGYFENLSAAQRGGEVAGYTRIQIEAAIGSKVISDKNYLTERQRQNNDATLPPELKVLLKKKK